MRRPEPRSSLVAAKAEFTAASDALEAMEKSTRRTWMRCKPAMRRSLNRQDRRFADRNDHVSQLEELKCKHAEELDVLRKESEAAVDGKLKP